MKFRLLIVVALLAGFSAVKAQEHFNHVDPTGVPYEIIIEEATLDGDTLQIGDEIGAFDDELCVGAEIVDGEWPLTLTTWEAEFGGEIPGFREGNPIYYRIWRSEEQREYSALAEYIVGNGTFGFGPYSQITLLASDFPEIELSSQHHNFGQVAYINESQWEFAVLNTGDQPVQVDSIVSPDESFLVNLQTFELEPEEQQTVEVTFHPNRNGEIQGSVLIYSNDPVHFPARITVVGVGLAPIISTPGRLDFEGDSLFQTLTRTINLRNAGDWEMEIHDIQSSDEHFTIDHELPILIAPNHGELVEIAFTPTEPIHYEAQITVSSNDPVNPESDFPVSGWGISAFTQELQGNYFELVSSFIELDQRNARLLFGDIEGLLIVYQNNGDIFFPPDLNTIGQIDLAQAYYIYCAIPSQWTFQGTALDPATEYNLEGGSWSWIGYPFPRPTGIESALEEVTDLVSIVLTDDGRYWIPGLINTIVEMAPGEGYMVYAQDDAVFQYNGDAPARIADSDFGTFPGRNDRISNHADGTGIPYVILVTLDEALRERINSKYSIRIYDNDLEVGSSEINSDDNLTPVVAWGAAPVSANRKEENSPQGFRAGDPILIKLTDAEGNEIPTTITGTPSRFAEGPYAEIALKGQFPEIPLEFSVGNAFPNPFNPALTVPFTLPQTGEVTFSVFNVLGQQVFNSVQVYEAGARSFIFDTSSTGTTQAHQLVSGIYFLQVQFNGQTNTQKVMLLR